MPAVETVGLSKHFRSRGRASPVRALDDVTLRVEPGEALGLVGPNGSGKTTLLRVLGGLLLPTSGRALVLGEDAARGGARLRDRVAYVGGGDRALSLRLTGRQNLRLFATLHGWSRAAREARVSERLDAVGLAADADRPVAEYSTGMHARLGLARGLLGAAEVLLLDEPTRGVDAAAADALRARLRDLAREGRTLLVASHDPDEVRALCARVARLEAGRLAAVSPSRTDDAPA